MTLRTRRAQRGFTLIEVMLALAILFAGLVVLIRGTAANIQTAQRADMLGVATDLSRSKMFDIEEELIHDGFQELDKNDEGDFDDEGWPEFSFEYEIQKVELPALTSLEALGEGGEDGEGGEGGAAQSPLGGLLGMAGGGGGGGAGGGAAGAGFIQSQFELISQILEASIRKVILTVHWEIAGYEEELQTVAYFTEPAAVNRVISGGGAAAATGSAGSAGSAGGTSGGSTTTSPPTTRGKGGQPTSGTAGR